MTWMDDVVAVVEREDAHNREINLFSRFCPVCDKDCGESDFEPSDPSVGIPEMQWWNSCKKHGEFRTLVGGKKMTESEDYA